MSCRSVKGCGKNCGCRKASLMCLIICDHCKGKWYPNFIKMKVDNLRDCTLIERVSDERVE